MSRRTVLVGILCLLTATACGSTVPAPSASGAGAGANGGGSGLSIPSTSTEGTTTSGGQGSSATGSSTGFTSGGGQGGGSGGTTGSTGGGSAGGGSRGVAAGPVPGITPTTIYVGARWIKNQDAANAAIGAAGAGGGDARDAYRAVIEEINKAGGIAGRKVVPIFAPLDASSSTPAEQQEQANCATWTQDNEVFVIFAGRDSIDYECAKDAGILELPSGASGGATVPETFQRYPHFVPIIGINLVRVGFVTVDGLATQGYFNKLAKVGMLTWDEPAYREGLQKGYIPALARHGLRLATEPIYLTPPQTVQDLSGMSAQVNNAVLKFQSLGIDHVMMLDGAAGVCGVGCMGFEFMHRAKAQRYYPRYGFNDFNVPKAGQAAGFYPNDQLSRSVGIGWLDLDKSYDEGSRINATRERCYELMRKHDVSLESVNDQGAALEACDELWFLQAAVARVDGPLTPDAVVSAVESFGSSYPSTAVYGTSFGPDKHEGVSAVRNYHFVDSCTCFKYTSDPYVPK